MNEHPKINFKQRPIMVIQNCFQRKNIQISKIVLFIGF